MTTTLIETVETTTNYGTIRNCPGWFTHGKCNNNHAFAKIIHCEKEWCPVCGKKNSSSHLRKFARWLPKIQTFHNMGYFIFTIPEEIRNRYTTKESLSLLQKQICNGDKSKGIDGLLKSLGYEVGLSRWHWFGDRSNKWNPHLNVLIESGYIKPQTLELIKYYWARLLQTNRIIENVRYDNSTKYPNPTGKMIHWLKYITRPTFKEYSWYPTMANELWNFRNNRSWGNWKERHQQWHLNKETNKIYQLTKLETNKCPICNEKIDWNPALPINLLISTPRILKEIKAGYYQLE